MRVTLWDEMPDIDPPTNRGWCCYCGCNVDVAKVDHGIGSYEYWGSRGVHRDVQDTCTVCGETDIECERNDATEALEV